jgi:hypothetical protein
MPKVELVYFEGCPHVGSARSHLRTALAEAGVATEWAEWDTDLPATPDPFRKFGSPTVLVDGRDVVGGVEGSGRGCVVSGAPSVAKIVAALQARAR